jgi:hypothetical protein
MTPIRHRRHFCTLLTIFDFGESVNLQFEPEVLRPLICQVVTETVAALEADRARIPDDRLAFSEEEAARMLGLKIFQLRDQRRLGRVGFSRGPGKRVLYIRQNLLDYLARRRVEPSANGIESATPAVARLKDAFGTNGKSRGKVRKARD